MQKYTSLPAIVLCLILVLPQSQVQAQAHVQKKNIDVTALFLKQNAQELGLSEADLASLVVTNQYVSKHNGVTHIFLQQRFADIPVFGAQINLSITKDGEILHVGNRFVPDLENAITSSAQALGPTDAVYAAARELELEVTEPLTIEPAAGKKVEQKGKSQHDVVLSRGGIALEPIPAELVYLPMIDGEIRLAWKVGIYTEDAQHYWSTFVDAASGEVLRFTDLVLQEHSGVFEEEGTSFLAEMRRARAQAPMIPYEYAVPSAPMVPLNGASYRVYPVPVESPSHAGDPFADLRDFVSSPADPTASSLGWHDDGSTAYTVTRGNNVHAYTDIDADNVPDPGSDPDGGAGLVFDFPLDLTQGPETYRDAAVTNLFYWNNIIHDIAYQYGFDEASGNFQVNNFGNGGEEGDDVRAEAQDGSGLNNANFFTPIDGFRPRMQMFRWTFGLPNELVVGAPVNDIYEMSGAAFGPAFDATGVTGTLVLANDGTGTTTDGCEPLTNGAAISGNIALIDRGACTFVSKVLNAQAVGATAVVIVNNNPGSPITLGGSNPSITIPSGMITMANGDVIKAALPGVGATARARTGGDPDRDSDFDNGVIVHEYAHGISIRLTGGPSENICLANFLVNGQVDGEQMGEGWSDYTALLLTDTDTDNRGIGTYLLFEPPTGGGIRPFPYSTSFAINPSTYATINNPGISVPHGVGTVWATMLWDMTRALVDRHGFDSDLYTGTGGNNIALQLVTDGLKLQPCFPGFVDGRDAILAADAAMGGANECLIWDAFANRGLGFSADQGFFYTRFDGTEAFDLPNTCCTFAILSGKVNDLKNDGVLNRGQANALLKKLQNAERMVERGQLSAAFNVLGAFTNQVHDLVNEGILTTEQGEDLISCALGVTSRTEQAYPAAQVAAAKAAAAQASTLLAGEDIPDNYALNDNYPNPFNPATAIRFALPEAEHVRLTVYDVMGREVKRLVDGALSAGFHEVSFEGGHLASGLYLYRIEAGAFVDVKRMVLLK